MNLLILLNGNKDKLLSANNFDTNDFEVIKLDEKMLAKPKFMISLLKKANYKAAYFGIKEMEFLRFNTFISLYILFSGIMSGGVIDEYGDSKKFSAFKFFFIEMPMLLIELVASAAVIIYSYLNYAYYKWRLVKRS